VSWKDKHIIVGVTGGIAAYKTPLLVREIRKAGSEIRVVMTESAAEFVTPMTLSTLSGGEVIVNTFPDQKTSAVRAGVWHIDLAQWADIMVIVPATANTIAKLAHGYADNAVTALALSLRCPLLIAPSMDVDMWRHEATQRNITALKELGYHVLLPEEGQLASGLTGPGRLPELAIIMEAVERILQHANRDFRGKKILVTAGPTHEPIDPVRFIGNRSSGKMGHAIAVAAAQRGADVTLVSGPVAISTPKNVRRIDVETAQEMYNVVMRSLGSQDALIMAAAVSDFTPAVPMTRKIRKEEITGKKLSLELKPTKDILQAVSERKNEIVVVGFALETGKGLANAKDKLKRKNLDFIVLNNADEPGAGFGTETNIVTIISKNGRAKRLPKMLKYDVAHEILNRVARILP